jgi:hypothetical protein
LREGLRSSGLNFVIRLVTFSIKVMAAALLSCYFRTVRTSSARFSLSPPPIELYARCPLRDRDRCRCLLCLCFSGDTERRFDSPNGCFSRLIRSFCSLTISSSRSAFFASICSHMSCRCWVSA